MRFTRSAPLTGGGTINGDLTITGDISVTGSSTVTSDEVLQGTSIIDVNDTEALLVRKDSDGGDVLTVDTTNMDVTVNGAKNTTTFSVTNNWSTTNDYIRIALNDATIRSTVLDSGARNLIFAPLGNDALTLHSTSGGATSVGIGTSTPSTNLHIYSAEDYNPTITIENAHAGSRSPFLSFKKSSSSPANNDKIGQIQFNGNDATGSSRLMAFIEAYTPDVTGGAYDGAFRFSQMINASQTEVMTITGGSVGIGTSSPTNQGSALHIYQNHASNNTFLTVESDGANASAYIDIDTAADRDGFIRFKEAGTDKASIFNDSSADSLVLTDGANSNTVYIKSDKVGIGNDSPVDLLHVGAGADSPDVDSVAIFTHTGTTNVAIRDASSDVELLNYAYSGGGLIGTATNHDLSIRTNNTNRLTITSGGKISINDSSSTKRLNVFDTDNAAGRFTRSTASATTGHLSDALVVRGKTGGDMADGFGTMIAFEINDSANSDNSIGGCGMMRDGADNSGKFFIANNNAGTYAANFYVDKTGNVGIGTASPARQLHVHGADGGQTDGLHITNTDTGATSSDGFTIGLDANENTFFFGRESGKSIDFYTNSVARFKLDDNSRISLSNNDAGGTGGQNSTSSNTTLGYKAGNAITSGTINNTFIGHNAGLVADGAVANVVVGTNSADALTTGDHNVALGYFALSATTDADDTIAIGSGAMELGNVSGDANIGIGRNVLQDLTTGAGNTCIGKNSGKNITAASLNTFIGHLSGGAGTDTTGPGSYNICIGEEAGYLLQGTGEKNIFIGQAAGDTCTTGVGNVIIGRTADVSDATATNRIGIGLDVSVGVNNAVVLGNNDVTAVYMAQDSGATVYADKYMSTTMPAFLVHPASSQDAFAENSAVTVVMGTERFDQGTNFASNTFTAPVTGRYQFNVQIQIKDAEIAYTYYQLILVTSNVNYVSTIDPRSFDQDVTLLALGLSILADMDASDTAYVQILAGGTAGGASHDLLEQSYFSGYLVC